ADVLICLSRRDSVRIYELYGRRPDVKIPITFKDIYNESKVKIDKNKGLLFVGSLFPPNYDGIKWFVDNVMIQLPDIKLTIVGKNFEIKKEQLEKDNVTVVGTVDNLSDYYYTYPVIVMPIQYGAGMKVKTAEALMYGKTIIATDEALEEYDIGETKGIHRCNTASEFVNAILSVFKDLDENETRSVFLKKYEFSVAQQKYGEIIMKIGNLSYDD
ncbi:MAG: glycosyltransferase family 4 protein, partial [Lachnospiraceae bacterium]